MPRKPRQPAKPVQPAPRRRKRWELRILAAALALLLGFAGWMHLTAMTVRVRYAEVRMADLPPSFDGTKVLYASDLDVCGLNTVRRMDNLFRKLQSLKPDLLLLGGDYASSSLLELLNGQTPAGKRAVRSELFGCLSDFYAPLGKLAISGDNDGDSDALKLATMTSGFKLIDGTAEILSNGADAIAVVGVGNDSAAISAMAANFQPGQCVIALMHSPERVVDVRIAEASGGGSWADLALAGHTHGGQLKIADRTAVSLTGQEQRFLSGWYTDAAAPLLVTEGVGCEGANFRLGTQSEVWLLTLRCK